MGSPAKVALDAVESGSAEAAGRAFALSSASLSVEFSDSDEDEEDDFEFFEDLMDDDDDFDDDDLEDFEEEDDDEEDTKELEDCGAGSEGVATSFFAFFFPATSSSRNSSRA